MTGRHEGRVAVVTGGAAGIGRAYALRLACEGAAVAVLDRADAADVVAEVEQGGGTAIAVRTDLTDAASVVAAQKEITARLGPATVLVNNAGIYPNQFVRAIRQPGALRAGLAVYEEYFTTAVQVARHAEQSLDIPVVGFGGETCLGGLTLASVQAVALKATGGVVERSGHWMPEERPDVIVEQALMLARMATA